MGVQIYNTNKNVRQQNRTLIGENDSVIPASAFPAQTFVDRRIDVSLLRWESG